MVDQLSVFVVVVGERNMMAVGSNASEAMGMDTLGCRCV